MTDPRTPPGTAEAAALMRVGAAAAAGDTARLVEALEGAVRAGASVDHLEEIILQTYVFAGFPRAINAFYTWQGWLVRTGRTRGQIVHEPDSPEAWRRRGEELCRRVYGESFEALQARLARLHPALAEWTLVEGYGKVLSRPGPEAARREAAAVGALIALDADRQLASHLSGALHVGLPRDALETAARTVGGEWERAETVERLLGELPAEGSAE
ncbi:MAG TPA: hypothetical protein VM778_00740 [Gemmatimonadota bacterium]|nr:hypothetical protein [Gemmatimonadota bacterium]